MPKDIIIGLHGVYHALLNADRSSKALLITSKGLAELESIYHVGMNKLRELKVEIIKCRDLNDFNKRAQLLYQQEQKTFRRLPSQVLLTTDPKVVYDVQDLFGACDKLSQFKLLALDRLTDVTNGGHIVRTAAFYGVHGIIVPAKNSFPFTPSFYRLASGGSEYIKFYTTAHLSRTLRQLQDRNVLTVGLSEEAGADANSTDLQLEHHQKRCLVLGAEDEGLSHSVERVLTQHLSLKPVGAIRSLNVGAAAALGMSLVFSS